MRRCFRDWLFRVAGILLVLALLPVNNRLVKAHPSVLWPEIGAMSIFMFVRAYQIELRKRG